MSSARGHYSELHDHEPDEPEQQPTPVLPFASTSSDSVDRADNNDDEEEAADEPTSSSDREQEQTQLLAPTPSNLPPLPPYEPPPKPTRRPLLAFGVFVALVSVFVAFLSLRHFRPSPPNLAASHSSPSTLYPTPQDLKSDTMVPRPQGKVNVGYFTNWGIYARGYKPEHIPAERLTHLLYAFANVKPTGEVHLTDAWSDEQIHYDGDSWEDTGNNLYGNFKQIYLLKKKHRHLKVLLSIGGWTYSPNFAAPCGTVEGRAEFVRSSIELLENYGLDGLDIDWEYPKNEGEAQNYVDLLRELREGLDRHAASKGIPYEHGYELTIAAPAGPSNYEKLKLREMDQYLSFWNLMAYDYSGSWESTAGHQAALYDQGGPNAISTDKAVRFFTGAGVPVDKIVIGIPLYGRSFLNCDGPGTPFQGVGAGSWEQGVYDYKALPLEGMQVSEDTKLIASSCYNPSTREWISYDSPSAAAYKADWIVTNGFAGGMYWELSGDTTGPESIVGIVASKLHLDRRENHLAFPGSKWDNLRSGM
ncbi:glycoside hydrolase family 18 protein [Pseudohyphozyma bogoriensis]|nr:glycoside hydrolase family 18 protein [Pseudohyphozyma bogoriensis]